MEIIAGCILRGNRRRLSPFSPILAPMRSHFVLLFRPPISSAHFHNRIKTCAQRKSHFANAVNDINNNNSKNCVCNKRLVPVKHCVNHHHGFSNIAQLVIINNPLFVRLDVGSFRTVRKIDWALFHPSIHPSIHHRIYFLGQKSTKRKKKQKLNLGKVLFIRWGFFCASYPRRHGVYICIFAPCPWTKW